MENFKVEVVMTNGRLVAGIGFSWMDGILLGLAVAMVPPVADFFYTQITGAVGIDDIWTETLSTGLTGYSPEVT